MINIKQSCTTSKKLNTQFLRIWRKEPFPVLLRENYVCTVMAFWLAYFTFNDVYIVGAGMIVERQIWEQEKLTAHLIFWDHPISFLFIMLISWIVCLSLKKILLIIVYCFTPLFYLRFMLIYFWKGTQRIGVLYSLG